MLVEGRERGEVSLNACRDAAEHRYAFDRLQQTEEVGPGQRRSLQIGPSQLPCHPRAELLTTGVGQAVHLPSPTSGFKAGDLNEADLLTERILNPLSLTHTWLPGHCLPDPTTASPSPLYAKQRRVELTSMIESWNAFCSSHSRCLLISSSKVPYKCGRITTGSAGSATRSANSERVAVIRD
ncbi:hypothetical protein [Nonomuraea sp. NPDC049400]|uniref:hypothetical protein n=1 Tax=Nonomuraea sp. NPDC049400 TaxID=3364352 RepID=UPI0037BB20FD